MAKYTIGPDINLDEEVVYQPDGSRLTEASALNLAATTLHCWDCVACQVETGLCYKHLNDD